MATVSLTKDSADRKALPICTGVLDYFPNASVPTDEELKRALRREMGRQNLKPILLRSTSGVTHNAFPLWIPVEIIDDSGEVGEFKALIAFVGGQVAGAMLGGLTGFLDKFDLELLPQHFELRARANSGVNCPLRSA